MSTPATDEETQDDSGFVNELRPFQLISSAKREVINRFFMDQTGLEREQFAANSWGFPPIPIPEPRTSSRRVRIAPKNVNDDFLGHPIYWIDPELTERQDDEGEEAWSIRMYYLLVGFGMFTENNEWIDFLMERGFDYDEQQIEKYHFLSNPRCFADEPDFALLGVDDLEQDLEYITSLSFNALWRCAGLLEQEIAVFKQNQESAYAQALAVIGPDYLYDTSVNYDSDGGYWARNLSPNINKINNEYTHRVHNDQGIAVITDDIYDVVEQCVRVMKTMDNYVATLSVPIIRSVEPEVGKFSSQMSFLSLSLHQNDARTEMYDFTDGIDNVMNGDRSEDSFLHLAWSLSDRYESCWKRLRLATVNFERNQIGLPPHKTYDMFFYEAMSDTNGKTVKEKRDDSILDDFLSDDK